MLHDFIMESLFSVQYWVLESSQQVLCTIRKYEWSRSQQSQMEDVSLFLFLLPLYHSLEYPDGRRKQYEKMVICFRHLMYLQLLQEKMSRFHGQIPGIRYYICQWLIIYKDYTAVHL